MPEELTIDDVRDVLNDVLYDNLCVQAWLGYANVLFVGFGKTVMPPVVPRRRSPPPPFELQIDWADWWIDNDNDDTTVGINQHPWKTAWKAATKLVGRRVTSWRFTHPEVALEICFEGGFRLGMAPYLDPDDFSEREAWVLYGSTDYYCVKWSGKVIKGPLDDDFAYV